MKVTKWTRFAALMLCSMLVFVSAASTALAMDVDVTKTWQDGNNAENTRPASVSIDLMRDDTVQQTLTIRESDNWFGVMQGVEQYDSTGSEIIYTLKEQPVSGYTTTIEQGEMISTYEYPTNISNVNPDLPETSTGTVPVRTGGTNSTNWFIQPGLRTDFIEATQVVFNSMNVTSATLQEFYPDGAPVPTNERVFWKNSGNGTQSNSANGNSITFIPRGNIPQNTIISTDHYITLTFPGAVTVLDGTSSGTTRDAVLTIKNINVARTTVTRGFQRIFYTNMWAGPGDSSHYFGGLSMDLTFTVPGVNEGDVLISFVDIDVINNMTLAGAGPRNESVSFVKGFSDSIYTLPLVNDNSNTRVTYTYFSEADGTMRAYARGQDTNSTLQSGMVARASLSDGGFTLRWTGSDCGTQLFSQVKPFKQKVTVDELTAGGTGGTITSQSDWVFRNYGEDEIITMTPDTGYHIKKITIDGNEIDLTGFSEDGVMTVTTGWTQDFNKGTETVTLYQRANGVVDVYLPKQYYAVNNTAPNRADHWIDVSYESNGVASTYTVKNVLNTQINGTKTWVRGTQTSPTNDALVFNLTRNGEPYAIDQATQLSWSGDNYTISGLPKYDENGQEYTYVVTEVVPAGYTVSYDPANPTDITNTLNQEYIEVVGRKNWKDSGKPHNNAQDLVVTLKRATTTDGTTYGSPEVVDWPIEWVNDTYYFRELPRYDDNRFEYRYTVSEELSASLLASLDAGDSYTSTVDDTGRNFTNTLRGTTEFSGTKTWLDDGLTHDNTTDVRLVLYWESQTVAKRQTGGGYAVSWSGDTYTYTGLPKYDSEGYPYTYSVRESQVMGTATQSSGYDVYYDGELWDYASYATPAAAYNVTGTDITNIKPTDISVIKTWNDNNDELGLRPEEMDITLYANDKAVTAAPTVTQDGSVWTYTWTGLRRHQFENKQLVEITYRMEEDAPSIYHQGETVVDENGNLMVINSLSSTSVTVKKAWEDDSDRDKIRPEELKLTLNGVPDTVRVPDPQIVRDGNTWTYTWTGLPESNGGKQIEYTVSEDTVPDGYQVSGSPAVSGGTITNTHEVEKVDVTVKKVWDDADNQDGKRPDELKVTLSNGDEVTLNQANGWEATIKGLPKNENGQAIQYTWTEAELPEGYVLGSTSEEKTETGLITTLTNTYTTETVTLTVKKVWDDADDHDGVRPGTVEVTLSNGLKATLSAKNQWTYVTAPLPKYANREEIKYTWTETSVPGYKLMSTETEGLVTTLTNSHTPTYSFTFTKRWDSDPLDSIDWTMYKADGTVVSKTFRKTAVSDKVWVYETTLDADEAYYIIESVPSGYQVSYENVGKYAGDTNRCYNGGTIINYKVPNTGDNANPALWIGLVLLGAALAGTLTLKKKMKR